MNKIATLDKYNIKPLYFQKKGKIDVITTNRGKYIIKKTNNSNIYEYLKVRNFNNFPNSITDNTDAYEIVEYVEDISVPDEQRIQDLIYLVSLLHTKTTFYKTVDVDLIKEMYETILNTQTELYNYYMNIQDIIETEIYMSPSHYLLIYNISSFYRCIRLSKEYIDKWYEISQSKKKMRYSMIHGNLDKSHLIENEALYLISWDLAKIGNPIYDLDNLYRKNYTRLDLCNMLDIYESKYELNIEEKYLLFSLLLLPTKIENRGTEFSDVKAVREVVEYISTIEEKIHTIIKNGC